MINFETIKQDNRTLEQIYFTIHACIWVGKGGRGQGVGRRGGKGGRGREGEGKGGAPCRKKLTRFAMSSL